MKKSEIRELYNAMFPEYPDILNVSDLQKMLGISRHLAYDLITNKDIVAITIGRAYKIPKPNVVVYLLRESDMCA